MDEVKAVVTSQTVVTSKTVVAPKADKGSKSTAALTDFLKKTSVTTSGVKNVPIEEKIEDDGSFEVLAGAGIHPSKKEAT